MSARPLARRCGAAVARAALALAALAVLWRTRPGWPELPASAGSPLTLELVGEVVTFAAWLALGCLALLAITGALRLGRRRRSAASGAPEPPLRASLRALSPPTPTPRRSPASKPSVAPSPYVLTVRSRVEASEAPAVASLEQDLSAACERRAAGGPAEGRSISISLLGPLAIAGARRARRAATRELVCFLALRPEGATRDELQEALWPGQDPLRSRPRLWQSVSEARRLLGGAFVRERDRYSLDRTRVGIDVEELERLISEANAASDEEAERKRLERALGLWRGRPLAGSEYRWAEGELRRLDACFAELVERVGRARLRTGDPRGALALAERGISQDELNEGFWRLALEAEGALGLRQSAGRRYELLRRTLDERLGLEPERETRVLYRRLLGRQGL